jgi:hypothetical protein
MNMSLSSDNDLQLDLPEMLEQIDDTDSDDGEDFDLLTDTDECDARRNDEVPKGDINSRGYYIERLKAGIYRSNPTKAIRDFCLECEGGSARNVTYCISQRCSLYPFRKGRNPFRIKKELTEEQKEQARQRFAAIRAAQD